MYLAHQRQRLGFILLNREPRGPPALNPPGQQACLRRCGGGGQANRVILRPGTRLAVKDDCLSGPGIEGRTVGQAGERHQFGIGNMFARVFIRITDINQSGALGNQRPGFGRG